MWIDGSMKMKKVKLESLALPEKGAIISGPFGSNISSKFFVERGVPVIRGNNLCLDYSKFNDSGFVFITQEKADELNCWADKEDLLFTAAGTLGQVGVLKEPLNFTRYVISNKQIRVRLDSTKVNTLYAYYWFSSPWMFKRIAGVNKGSTVPLLTLAEIRDLPIFLPENRSTQDAIVEVLESISNKIALNKKMNQKLEAMAKRLYDYWFVQYDFPDKNGHPYKTTGGPMTYNPTLKREIPEGWNDGVLSDIANITMGQSPDGASYNEDGEGMIFYQGSTDFGMRFPTVRQYTTAPTRFAKKGDILMSVRAPVGAVNIANTDCCIGRGLSALNSKLGSLSHLYFLIDVFKKTFENKNTVGTTFGSITKDELYTLPVVIPDKSVIEQFEKMAKPIFDRQMKLGEESNCLTKLRDKLLPLLMNGQVAVA